MCKTVKNAIKICYSKRQSVSASAETYVPQTPYQGAPPLDPAGGLPSP